MTIEEQIARLGAAVGGLRRAVSALSAEDFLRPLPSPRGGEGWSPRDIVAHLVGWNRHVILGSRQIARGELPFYDLDPGESYSKVNAVLIREYPSRDPVALARELEGSAAELAAFLQGLETAVWSRDHGVRHAGTVVTIRGTVDELIADYDHHREQIESLDA